MLVHDVFGALHQLGESMLDLFNLSKYYLFQGDPIAEPYSSTGLTVDMYNKRSDLRSLIIKRSHYKAQLTNCLV